jgi:hypothetical protein
MITVSESLMAMVSPEPDSGCWLWLGAVTPGGYARLRDGYAHRMSYEIHVGPIPPGLQLDHLCRVRSCVNPAHLEAVTQKINIGRGEAGMHMRERTHCPRGHERTPENTYTRIKRGHSECRICRQKNWTEQNAKRAARRVLAKNS